MLHLLGFFGCNLVASGCCFFSYPCIPAFPSVHPSLPPSPWLANRGAAFQQCPLSKHLYCGMLLILLCQTKARSQWNNPAGRRPSPRVIRGRWAAPQQPTWTARPSNDSRAGNKHFICERVCVFAGSEQNPKFTGHAHLLPDKQILLYNEEFKPSPPLLRQRCLTFVLLLLGGDLWPCNCCSSTFFFCDCKTAACVINRALFKITKLLGNL